ncbi:putative protein C-ets-1 [Triplophysa rosa]|uniref:Uncharacterized protein n=1 Tax=Triplophysa rosa TaxID=992332 RepID=A0A9W7TUB3_TRIRA|nr:putative protein C-ets-1 [Triplophysa rosa]
MSYYLDPVSSYQTLQPPNCLGAMRPSGGMAVTMVPQMQPPAVCHPQNPAPARHLYAHHITLQEVPNGPEYSPNVNPALAPVLGLHLHAGHKATRVQGRMASAAAIVFPSLGAPWGIARGTGPGRV